MNGTDEWLVAVAPTRSSQAKREFAGWLAERGLEASQFGNADIEVDVYHSPTDVEGEPLMRYQVRRRALEALLAPDDRRDTVSVG